jgi:predicted ATPase/class 3 adenylate cyclase/DNA-binding CsgD family transcriptional regulator
MVSAPSGTVTLLFTDIEGSTALWESHRAGMQGALERHDTLLRSAVEAHGGHVFKTVGDAFCVVFATADQAVSGAVAAQRALSEERWTEPLVLRVRMGLHSGVCSERDGDYFGPTVNRTARLQSIAHGEQTLLSEVAAALALEHLPEGVALRDLGEHRLRDLERPERVFQLDIEGLPDAFPALRSLSRASIRHNLPRRSSAFIGRDRELEELGRLLTASRLVTVTGPGGSGKTRLALELAAELVDRFGDGIWFVDFAPLADPGRVSFAVANVLGIREEPTSPMLDTLVTAAGNQELLLILDNCEHVIDEAATLARSFLDSCPRVELLTTSREPLAVSAEQVYRIPALDVPADDVVDVHTLTSNDSVRLLTAQARLHKPSFLVDATNSSAIASICRRLDGIPLAIELAAARLRALSPADLDLRLNERLPLLSTPSRDALPRQKTLEALIDWSWNLLSDPERRLLAVLSVFPASFDLEAGEAVAPRDDGSAADACDRLASLVDKSLVHADEVDGKTRYRLLETVRQYAVAKLSHPAAEFARRAHQEHYLALAEAAKPRLHTHEAKTWIDRLRREHDNLRAALATAIEDPDPSQGLRLVGALSDFWGSRGYGPEVVDMVDTLLNAPRAQEPTIPRARALIAAGALTLGDYAAGRARGEEALAIAETLEDAEATCEALWCLSWAHEAIGEHQAGFAMVDRALSLAEPLENLELRARLLNERAGQFQSLGDPLAARADHEEALRLHRVLSNLQGIAAVENDLGDLAIHEGDITGAREHLQESLSASRQVGDESTTAIATVNLGLVEYLDGNALRARDACLDGLVIGRRIGSRVAVSYALLGLALAATAAGEPRSAARLHGALDRSVEQLNPLLFEPTEVELRDADLARLRTELGDAAFEEARERGCEMSLDEAVALDHAPPLKGDGHPARGPKLSRREQELLGLVADGLTDAQIAERLVISVKTVHSHLDRIRDKTGARRRPELIQFALSLTGDAPI